MKKLNLLAHHFMAGTVALAILALATTASAENVAQVITVLKIDGPAARYSTDNKNWHDLHRGDVLKPGSIIQTAESTTVDILMGGRVSSMSTQPKPAPPIDVTGVDTSAPPPAQASADSGPKSNIVRIFPSSVLAIDKLVLERTGMDDVADTQLDLRAGQIMGNVKKLSASSHYEVKIPNGVAGIRGTVYVVGASGVVYVIEGQVIISYVNPQGQLVTATVSAGQSFNPTQGPDGTVGTIPRPVEQTLLTIVDILQRILGPINSPPTTYVDNHIPIHVSPEGP